MRTIWNGSITFGLVNIPVGLALATKPAAKQSDVSFRMLHAECKTPIKQKRWCPTHDREVGPDEIVKGWEVAKNEFVVVEESDLEAIERNDDSRSIEIARFVPTDSVDPIWYDRTYFLTPSSNAAQRKPYALLLEAMRESGRCALARWAWKGKEYVVQVRPGEDGLVLQQLLYADEVRSMNEMMSIVWRAVSSSAFSSSGLNMT